MGPDTCSNNLYSYSVCMESSYSMGVLEYGYIPLLPIYRV